MSKPKQSSRSATEIDRQIGRRLRAARQLRNQSQEQLGTLVGVTHQQVQKYERGASRIPSGRLWNIARALDLPVSFFYPVASDQAFDEMLTQFDLPADLDAPKAARLLQSLSAVKPAVRASLINVIAAIDGQKG